MGEHSALSTARCDNAVSGGVACDRFDDVSLWDLGGLPIVQELLSRQKLGARKPTTLCHRRRQTQNETHLSAKQTTDTNRRQTHTPKRHDAR